MVGLWVRVSRIQPQLCQASESGKESALVPKSPFIYWKWCIFGVIYMDRSENYSIEEQKWVLMFLGAE